MKKIKERLREILKINHISQAELARKINMSQSVVNNYCTGKRKPSIDALYLICKVLDESIDYLVELEK